MHERRSPACPPRRAGRAGAGAVRGLAMVVFAVSGTACYSYSAVRPAEVAPGQDVRVTVDASLAEAYEDVLGSTDRAWEGRVEDRGAESVVIAVPTSVHEGREGSRVLRQRVEVRNEEMLTLEARALDWRKTGAAVGLTGIAVAVAIVRGWTGLGGTGDEGPSEPGPQQIGPG
ncbi:MAG: hypothetical protein U5R14_11185 [Gemmatimonadota bacterium]|nr:hypothetical protein [Gemmatimonadota bacterium]